MTVSPRRLLGWTALLDAVNWKNTEFVKYLVTVPGAPKGPPSSQPCFGGAPLCGAAALSQ